jgi:hypothetical protein
MTKTSNGLPLTIPLEIPAYWTPEQAFAVVELLDDRIWAPAMPLNFHFEFSNIKPECYECLGSRAEEADQHEFRDRGPSAAQLLPCFLRRTTLKYTSCWTNVDHHRYHVLDGCNDQL